MKQGNLKKKVGSLLLAAAMVVTSFPSYSKEVHAAGNTLPDVSQFATVDDLKSFNTNDKDGEVKAAKVYFGNDSQQWWIAGSQYGTGVTLFAATPLATKQQFATDWENPIPYDKEWKCTYPNGEPTEVDPNHYGASPLRKMLKDMETSYFTGAEQRWMKDTTIYTRETEYAVKTFYSTTDKLYLSYGRYPNYTTDYVSVGENSEDALESGLHVDNKYWTDSIFWLRMALANVPSNVAAGGPTGDVVGSVNVSGHFDVVPAFELDLSAVSFASAAPAASSDGNLALQDTDGDGAFTLRYKSPSEIGTATVSQSKKSVVVTGVTNENTYLVVQNKDGAWSKKVAGNDLVLADEMSNTLTSFENCKVWLETTNERITYASEATHGNGYHVSVVGGKDLNVTGGMQTNVSADISDITVEVAEGYYLPDTYISGITGLNGLKITKTNTGFTISGTPASDVKIILPPATPLPKAEKPAVELKTTSTSITVTVTNHQTEFGDIEYKWDDGNWEKNKNTLSDLEPNTTHQLAVRYKGDGFYQTSEEFTATITTLQDGNTVVIEPKDVTAIYSVGLKLADVKLPEGWVWAEGETALSAGTKSYPAAFDTRSLESTTDFSNVKGYDENAHTVTRNIEVQVDKAKSKVEITTQSLDKIYDGGAVKKPEYETSGSDGEVTITWQKNAGTEDNPTWEDLESAPSAAGDYQVVVELAGNDNYNSASATLGFVISQAENSWEEELSITGWIYNGNPGLPSAKAQFGDVTFTYSSKENGTYTSEVPKNAGTWYVKASVAETTNYTGLTSDPIKFEITKADTNVSVSLKDGKSDYTYGDIIELSVSVAPGKTRTVAQNKAAVFVGENQITEEFSITEGKPVDISIDTTDENVKKYLKPRGSKNLLTVKYGGSDNLNEKAGSVSIMLAKKDSSIGFKDGLDLNKTYDGQPVELNAQEDVIKEGSSKNVTISWKTAEGTVLDKAPVHAGTYKAVASVETDDYYKGASAEKEFTISKATPIPDKITGLVLGQGMTLKELELPNGFAWADNTQIAEELGTHEFKAIFTPEDTTNYEQVEVMVAVEVVPKLMPVNHVPTITANDKDLSVGDEFDPLKDVTASDKEDGDLTSKIEVVDNKVDTSKAGIYTVTYKVIDSQGAGITKTIKVVVKEKEKPTVPEKSDAGNTKNQSAVKTGDETSLGVWIMIFTAAGLGIVIMALLKRKKSK